MRQKDKGFTLLEVLVSIAILAGSYIIITTSESANFLRIRKSRLNNNVAVLLQRKMSEIEATYRDKPLSEVPEELAGDFGKDFPRYRWEFKSQQFEMPDLTSVLVGQDGGANESLISIIKQTTEFISKSVKEVSVSVFVKAAKKELEYSVSTYFVDYDSDIPLGPASLGGGDDSSSDDGSSPGSGEGATP